jgi:hypothetical protein
MSYTTCKNTNALALLYTGCWTMESITHIIKFATHYILVEKIKIILKH